MWPDIETKNERLLPIVLREAATHNCVVLVNSYMPLQHTTWLKRQGFLVVLLDVPPDELRRRDRQRLQAEGWSNAEWFGWHQSVIREHLDAGLVDDVLDGN